MKIIFLDIDGVLNSDSWYKSINPEERLNPDIHFDPRNIQLLNKLVLKTGAKIVLSSTWRIRYSLAEMQNILKTKGANIEIVDFTPDLTSKDDSFTRGNEILKWCKENEKVIGCKYSKYKTYAIIDDNDDMLYWQRNNFFQTDRYVGLTPSVVQKIIKFLN